MIRSMYWEEETPKIMATDFNVFRWYENAGRLQVSMPDWDKDGETKQGKTVTISLSTLDAKARKFLTEILTKEDT